MRRELSRPIVSEEVHHAIRGAIVAFLRGYRTKSRVGNKVEKKSKKNPENPEGAYYWSERDVQCELFNELRKRFEEIGKENWVHAEGYIETPRKVKGEKSKHPDIVVINLEKYLRWHSKRGEEIVDKKSKNGKKDEEDRFPAYEAVIEVEWMWRGLLKNGIWRWDGSKLRRTRKDVRDCLERLSDWKRNDKTIEAHLILLDSIQEKGPQKGKPYFSSKDIREIRNDYRDVYLWHWPDFEKPTRPVPEQDGLLYYGHRGRFPIFADPTCLNRTLGL